MDNIWKSSLLRSLKIRLFTTTIEPVLTYGAETWTSTTRMKKALLAEDTGLDAQDLKNCMEDRVYGGAITSVRLWSRHKQIYNKQASKQASKQREIPKMTLLSHILISHRPIKQLLFCIKIYNWIEGLKITRNSGNSTLYHNVRRLYWTCIVMKIPKKKTDVFSPNPSTGLSCKYVWSTRIYIKKLQQLASSIRNAPDKNSFSLWVLPNYTCGHANHTMSMQNLCHEHKLVCWFMPLNMNCYSVHDLYPLINHVLNNKTFCAWSQGMRITFMHMKIKINVFVIWDSCPWTCINCEWSCSCMNWAWTGHELCMKLPWLWTWKTWNMFNNNSQISCMLLAKIHCLLSINMAWPWQSHGIFLLSLYCTRHTPLKQ